MSPSSTHTQGTRAALLAARRLQAEALPEDQASCPLQAASGHAPARGGKRPPSHQPLFVGTQSPRLERQSLTATAAEPTRRKGGSQELGQTYGG